MTSTRAFARKPNCPSRLTMTGLASATVPTTVARFPGVSCASSDHRIGLIACALRSSTHDRLNVSRSTLVRYSLPGAASWLVKPGRRSVCRDTKGHHLAWLSGDRPVSGCHVLDKEPPVSVDVSAEPADLEQGRARWRTAVAGVLAKSTRRDVDELGPEPEQMLETSTYEAVAIRALYTALDELPEPPLPGEWPFLRGADALRDVKSGWKVAEAIPANRVAGVAAEDVNSAVLAGLAEGVSALLVRVGESGVLPGQLEQVFEGVYLSMAPVILDAGADYRAAGEAMLELVGRVEPDQREILSIDLGADPLTAALSERPAPALSEVVDMATLAGRQHRGPGDHRRRARVPQSRRQRDVGTRRQHLGRSVVPAGAHRIRPAGGQGAGADQLPVGRRRRPVLDDRQSQSVAPAVGTRRRGRRCAGQRRGRHACRNIAADDDPARSLGEHAADDIGRVRGRRRRRRHCAGIPFDVAIEGGFPGMATSFARRMARNIQLLLLEESHVGRILDPAGGSWFVEDLTNQLAHQAWQTFQAIEQHGGFVEARRLHRGADR